MGCHTLGETDHSPLEQIFKKNVAEVPARLQRMILACLKYDIDVKSQGSKHPPLTHCQEYVHPKKPTAKEEHKVSFISGLRCPISIERIKEESLKDSTQNLLKDTIFRGWPEQRNNVPYELFEYWTFRCNLVLDDGLILTNNPSHSVKNC